MPTMTYADRYRAGLAYLVDLAADVQYTQDNPGAYPAEWREDALLCVGAARCRGDVIVSDHRGRLCGQHARTTR